MKTIIVTTFYIGTSRVFFMIFFQFITMLHKKFNAFLFWCESKCELRDSEKKHMERNLYFNHADNFFIFSQIQAKIW